MRVLGIYNAAMPCVLLPGAKSLEIVGIFARVSYNDDTDQALVENGAVSLQEGVNLSLPEWNCQIISCLNKTQFHPPIAPKCPTTIPVSRYVRSPVDYSCCKGSQSFMAKPSSVLLTKSTYVTLTVRIKLTIFGGVFPVK